MKERKESISRKLLDFFFCHKLVKMYNCTLIHVSIFYIYFSFSNFNKYNNPNERIAINQTEKQQKMPESRKKFWGAAHFLKRQGKTSYHMIYYFLMVRSF